MERFVFKEPLKGYEIKFELVNVDRVRIPEIQREISDRLIKQLAESIHRIGFVEPIITVEGKDGFLEVINGQHRLEAAKLVGLREIPVLILPRDVMKHIISLNIEKAPALRDKAHQAYMVFMMGLEENPDMLESELINLIDFAYYITIGFIIDRFNINRFPGYAFEKVLNKVDDFTSFALKDAEKERERRAKLLMEVRDVLEQRYKELGLKNALTKEQIVLKAFQQNYGKWVRNVEDDFYTVFERIKNTIPTVFVEESEEFSQW
ncbi:MAG: ParB/RepB/Spo0J family partition protein [candidate division WOR-3 bacterium]